MAVSNTAVARGKACLAAAKRLQKSGLNTEEVARLEALLDRTIAVGETRSPFHQAVHNAVWDAKMDYAANGFDGIPIPTDGQAGIVRCVHEGICPTCGKRAYIVHDEQVRVERPEPVETEDGYFEHYMDLPKWDTRTETTVRCVDDHYATASPTLHDWVGWRS